MLRSVEPATNGLGPQSLSPEAVAWTRSYYDVKMAWHLIERTEALGIIQMSVKRHLTFFHKQPMNELRQFNLNLDRIFLSF